MADKLTPPYTREYLVINFFYVFLYFYLAAITEYCIFVSYKNGKTKRYELSKHKK